MGYLLMFMGGMRFGVIICGCTGVWGIIVRFMVVLFGMRMVMMGGERKGLNELPEDL